MRVIAGTNKGRRLYTPRTHHVRPTSDRVREALFSILGNRLAHSRMLDLYAGTGAVSIEALSRGAAHVTSVEVDSEALKLLRQNMEICRAGDACSLRPHAVEEFLCNPSQWSGPYDIVFADPPYADALKLSTLLADPVTDRLFAADAWLVIEHATRTTLPVALGGTHFLRRYRYGDTTLSLYSGPSTVRP